MKNINGLNAIMMGASGGIGSATCRVLAKHGVNFAICSIDAEGLEKLAEELRAAGAKVLAKVVNNTVEKEVDAFIDEAVATFGKPDVLINFAGLSITSKVGELSEANWDTVLNVNLKGMFLSSKAFIRHLDPEKGGQIINFGSMASKRPGATNPHYSAAKAAVNTFGQGMAQQYKADNLRVTTLNPGPVNTTFFAGRIPEDKRGDFMVANDVAEVIEFILTRDDRIVFHDVMFDSMAYFKR